MAGLQTTDPIVLSDPEILGGTPCFAGTRVPVYNLFEYLENGADLDEFLDSFPTVSREQAIQALDRAGKRFLEEHSSPSASA